MSFNGTEGAPIDLPTASEFTANYRLQNPDSIKGNFFGKDIIKQILAQEGCMGIRFYYATTDTGQNTLVMVGADANENDQVAGTIADFSRPCPPVCGATNPLNS